MSRFTNHGYSPLGVQHSNPYQRRNPRIPVVPMDSARRANNFANRHGFLIGLCIAAAGAIAFCGPL